MKQSKFLRILVCAFAMVMALFLSFAGSVQAASVSSTAGVQKFDPRKLIGAIPNWQGAVKIGSTNGSAKVTLPPIPCLTNPTVTPANPRCYSPQQLYKTYDVKGLLNSGITGKGQTIVIIDDSSSPTIQSDLNLYDQIYGLKDPKLNVIAPFGLPPTNGDYVETALDVETAHSLAPDATIDLVVANTSSAQTDQAYFVALLNVVQYAVDHNLGSTISISYGAGESCFDSTYLSYQHTVFQHARAKGIGVFVSSGDSGAAIFNCASPTATTGFSLTKGVNVLASDPLVTSVGGTTLDAKVGSGTYVSETAWDNDATVGGATGGGFSTVYPRPEYQNGVPGTGAMRGLPDVSWDADSLTGVPVVFSLGGGLYIVPVGGTSVGAPAWGGLNALFDQYAGKRLGFLNDAFYRILQNKSYSKGFRDIKTGNNTVTGFDSNGNLITVTGYPAGPGWDASTGVGTPKVSDLAPLLKQYVYKGDGSGL